MPETWEIVYKIIIESFCLC